MQKFFRSSFKKFKKRNVYSIPFYAQRWPAPAQNCTFFPLHDYYCVTMMTMPMTMGLHLLIHHRLTKLFFFSFIFYFTGAFAGNSRKFRTEFLQDFPTPGTGPYFDTTVSSNVTGLVGKTVHLVCKVKNLGNRTVSILRTWKSWLLCCKLFFT